MAAALAAAGIGGGNGSLSAGSPSNHLDEAAVQDMTTNGVPVFVYENGRRNAHKVQILPGRDGLRLLPLGSTVVRVQTMHKAGKTRSSGVSCDGDNADGSISFLFRDVEELEVGRNCDFFYDLPSDTQSDHTAATCLTVFWRVDASAQGLTLTHEENAHEADAAQGEDAQQRSASKAQLHKKLSRPFNNEEEEEVEKVALNLKFCSHRVRDWTVAAILETRPDIVVEG